MDSQEDLSCSPYHVGQVLTVKLSDDSSQMRLLVTKINQPWTLSCGMVVDILDHEQNHTRHSQAFLKLFDRRFATQLRDDWAVDDWTEEAERDYIEYAGSDEAIEFLHKVQHERGFAWKNSHEFDTVEDETFLAYKCASLYAAEVTAYKALQEYQGNIIPEFIATVTLEPGIPTTIFGCERTSHLSDVQGILIEYVRGFALSDIVTCAPKPAWPEIIHQAIQIVHVLGDKNVLNQDVRPGNFIVSEIEDGSLSGSEDESPRYRVKMIDFGLSRLRGDDESDFVWGRAKWRQDEEGAVGMVMKNTLQEIGYQLEFKHSWRYLEWAEREDE